MEQDKKIAFIERARRLLKFKKLDAPESVIEQERELVKRSLAELTPDEVAFCMEAYSSAVKKLEQIEAEVEAENPVYPED